MAEYSRAEFAKKCGVTNSYVAVNIKRGKVIETTYKDQWKQTKVVIDDKNPINQEFLVKRLNPEYKQPKKQHQKKKRGRPKKTETIIEKSEPERVSVFTKVEPEKEVIERHVEPNTLEAAQLEDWKQKKQKEELDNEKKAYEIELLKVKLQKAQGEVLPTDLVSNVFAQHFKSITTAFYNGAENFISIIAKETGLSKEKTAKLRGELIEVVNQSVKEGIDSSKKSIKNLVQEYSEVRGVGERK